MKKESTISKMLKTSLLIPLTLTTLFAISSVAYRYAQHESVIHDHLQQRYVSNSLPVATLTHDIKSRDLWVCRYLTLDQFHDE